MELTPEGKEAVAVAWGWDAVVPYQRLFVDDLGTETWERGVEPNPETAAAYFDRKYAGLVETIGAERADAAALAEVMP